MIDVIKHIAGTYKALRLLLFLVGFSMPLVLMIGGKIKADIPLATHSMSAYYHLSAAPSVAANGDYGYTNIPANLGAMRNWFVGALFAVGTLLIAYKGIRPVEDWVLNFAGIMAWGVAVFPMKWPILSEKAPFSLERVFSSMSLHGTCAAVLFLCIAYVCIFRAWDTVTEELMPDPAKRKRYKFGYQVLGWLMGLSPFWAWAFTMGSPNHLTFWIEAFGVWTFATYWFVKSRELSEINFDEKAMRGEIHVPKLKSKMDLLRQVPVTKTAP